MLGQNLKSKQKNGANSYGYTLVHRKLNDKEKAVGKSCVSCKREFGIR